MCPRTKKMERKRVVWLMLARHMSPGWGGRVKSTRELLEVSRAGVGSVRGAWEGKVVNVIQ